MRAKRRHMTYARMNVEIDGTPFMGVMLQGSGGICSSARRVRQVLARVQETGAQVRIFTDEERSFEVAARSVVLLGAREASS